MRNGAFPFSGFCHRGFSHATSIKATVGVTLIAIGGRWLNLRYINIRCHTEYA
ncbi:hypothetical protein P175DRAFT_0532513 [Aspergillus ochraceoroseus IBT 24754]|uniref:Uncharacterized protein n=1 Tax=Aspergillus ochraceoroseus IBT 24754 TaxID=1392256 RepID=A0A2T5LXX0_9EURO|nr:uncharacterized protein P175DRAFT_0532513 [Aspergillus ochraceoroseus IBT 24754]PTU21136.1 hypothetical protein P175DRAFT_0532513 [Aspergillus ochraceoroseus IBT 24754]